jgi:hypothetical protein
LGIVIFIFFRRCWYVVKLLCDGRTNNHLHLLVRYAPCKAAYQQRQGKWLIEINNGRYIALVHMADGELTISNKSLERI